MSKEPWPLDRALAAITNLLGLSTGLLGFVVAYIVLFGGY